MRRKSTIGYKNKFGYLCMNCGQPGNIVHHIVPLSRGGLDHSDNWMVLCQACHSKQKLHKNFEIMELPLATKKHYFEMGQEIEKIPQAFIIGPQRMINLIHPRTRINLLITPQTKIEASTRPPLSEEDILCPCGCGERVIGRGGKKYFSRQCKDCVRNRARYEKQKLAVMLAYRLEELIPTIKRLADEVLELHEVRKGG